MDKYQPEDKDILKQLVRINRLLGVLISFNIQDSGLTMAEAVQVMSRAGLTPSEIASILGTSPHNVSVALYASRKRPAKRAQEEESS